MIEKLSDAELYELTRYRRPAEQLRELAKLGVPARRMRDNTVCVLRMHLHAPAAPAPSIRPKLKL
ncbi:DUF4224 domain-containing protein [Pseudoduganella sp. SL102]|uniref:DUF4224 domain-containing protein n=1 Tax=Pseudoduganella sp. SL102 TaxID=2995154 RepID=UPI00248B8407|nr:DUF4224 domain-containing protein [Pseudoduganella sp. SL102]WBS00258.1 DUF4224 domain-containing protein [Pseudoduganella sp. SL102]